MINAEIMMQLELNTFVHHVSTSPPQSHFEEHVATRPQNRSSRDDRLTFEKMHRLDQLVIG